ncbi:MAG: cytochrome bc complex cytochrome b subunit, partial [Chloroflexota bacterium]|nr:cytochrome bc complex cytochrome b subunit [Chloroflexota bacterium]
MAATTPAEKAAKPGVPRRVGGWVQERTHIADGLLPIIQHPVPKAINWWYVLGSATLLSFVNQVVTGVALAMTYVPAPDQAYQSLNFITHDATWGSVVRGMHYFGASAMVVLISAHVIRVFLMGSYKYPRELNWLTGVFLLGLTAAMAFSGQLLRWDQDAYWAVVVAAEQAGKTPLIGQILAQVVVAGQTVGGPTLTRFFATHVFLLPALMFTFIGVHLYLVVFDGISEPPRAGEVVDPRTYRERYHQLLEKAGVPFFPDAAWRDAAFACAVMAAILLLSLFIGAPELGQKADPTIVQASPRPDWYFLWYFAVLAMIPPAIENWVILGVPALIGALLFAVPFVSQGGERSPKRRPWSVAAVAFMLVALSALTVEGNNANWSPMMDAATAAPIPASL